MLQFIIFSSLERLITLPELRKAHRSYFSYTCVSSARKPGAIKPGDSTVCTISAQLPHTTSVAAVSAITEITAYITTAPANSGPEGGGGYPLHATHLRTLTVLCIQSYI